ncbi:MAG: DUF2911 domain-containing protein [Chthoniobacterales bacterium]|jgi:hypothetical protein|nr:DUF2911 domain-containing protein [Chthoniobacterales bacterium]
MKRFNASLLVLPALLLALSPLAAQDKQRVSPHETVNATIDGNEVSVVYGRPYSKDPKSGEKRKIWGGVIPFSKVWRMGADEATLLTTKQPLDMNGTAIPAGSYSLFLLPEEGGNAKLIVNKQTGQWGTRYDEKQDLARIEMKKEATAKTADQFTIAIEKADAGGGVLRLMWEEAQYSVPFTVTK